MRIVQRICILYGILLFSAGLCFSGDPVEITQANSGRTIQILPVQVTEIEVTFRLNDQNFTVPLNSLTAASQESLKKWREEQANKVQGSVAEVNQVVGHPLLEEKESLWEEPAEEVAKRLGWPMESQVATSSSFRFYPKPDYGFINAHPYCATLYGDPDGKVDQISLVYSNKGDYGSTAGFAEEHFQSTGDLPDAKDLNGAIHRDAAAITLALTQAAGAPVEQRYGEKEDRRSVLRWDYKGHSFILSEKKSEYTHLLIASSEAADNEGKQEAIRDEILRPILEKNVVHEDNGDVRILNIPMVDQGPKGYCAPATFERAMRYMSIPADMYLLATLATGVGGGTNTTLLASESKRIIRSKARRIRDLDLDKSLSLRTVSRYIDKGVPILWQMAVMPEYSEIANERTKEREEVTDYAQWAEKIAAEAKLMAPKISPTDNFHVCMIVGYNSNTNELAISDSWGPRYELRWVHIDIAKAVTIQGGFIIDI